MYNGKWIYGECLLSQSQSSPRVSVLCNFGEWVRSPVSSVELSEPGPASWRVVLNSRSVQKDLEPEFISNIQQETFIIIIILNRVWWICYSYILRFRKPGIMGNIQRSVVFQFSQSSTQHTERLYSKWKPLYHNMRLQMELLFRKELHSGALNFLNLSCSHFTGMNPGFVLSLYFKSLFLQHNIWIIHFKHSQAPSSIILYLFAVVTSYCRTCVTVLVTQREEETHGRC